MLDYKNKTVLITGGTGSFGRTMATHLLQHNVHEIRILSRDEAKQHYMRTEFNDSRLSFHLGDVRDKHTVDRAIRGVNMVFHAAALKQVPSCEFFPMQAVMTNVAGSANVLSSSQENGVESVVCLSTDKAVQPVNAMGMTKALMEKVAQTASRDGYSKTTVSIVRYGNVLYSRGSVIPLFIDQIFNGSSLTVTDPAMTRFLMPLTQCIDLVEHAFFSASSGDVFVRKAPAASMQDLATAIPELFGIEPEIKIIGQRHGEKLYETLASADELRRAEDMGDYYRIPMDSRDLNYADYYERGTGNTGEFADYHSHNTKRLSVAEIKTLLLVLPEIKTALAKWSRT